MLSAEEIERIETFSVESQRARYTDAHLWAWLTVKNAEQMRVLRIIPGAYRRAHSSKADRQFHQDNWLTLVGMLDATQRVMDCIVWHLSKRGDPTIKTWAADNEELQRKILIEEIHRGCRLARVR